MKITREIKTAILVIASILLFIWGYSFLKGKDLFTSYTTLFVKYPNVEGLVNSAPVTINGLTIGKVNSIKMQEDYTSVVELQINNGYHFPKSSIAEIYSPGPIGGRQISIIPGINDNSVVENGDFLRSSSKLGLTDALSEKLVPTQKKIEHLVTDADKLVVNLNSVFDDQTKQNLKNSIAQLNQTLSQINKATQKVNGMLASNEQKINASLTNVEKVSGNFAKIADDLEKAKLGETVKTLENTLANVNKIMSEIESGKGSMGKLLKDESMYNNLTKASKELELLLQDVRLHPTRYVNVSVFGKKEKPYVEPVQKK